jgi:radical SAM-linked protein
MDKLRMRFEKTGRAVYISHLDLMHTLQRAFSRAGFRIKYSEGYNPHPVISIALPLSVGTASVCELMDFRLTEEIEQSSVAEAMNRCLPEGIRVLEVYQAERKASELKWLKLNGRMEYDRLDTDQAADALESFFSQESIVISKKSKRGFSDFDLIPAVRELSFFPDKENKTVRLDMTVSAQEPTFNPDLLCEALRQKAPDLEPDFAAYTRIETYDANMVVFR